MLTITSGCIAGSYSRTPKKERCVQHSDGCGSKLLTLIHGWLISPNSCFPSHTKCLHGDCKWFQSATSLLSRKRPYKDHELEISQIFLQRTILSLALRGWDWIRCSHHANHFLTLVFTSSAIEWSLGQRLTEWLTRHELCACPGSANAIATA